MKAIKLIPLAIGLMLGSAQAAPISILNFSFEDPVVTPGPPAVFNTAVTDWQDLGGAGDNGVFRGNGDFGQLDAPTDGVQIAFINDVRTAALVQTVAATYQTGVDYSLKVDIASRGAPANALDGATLVLYWGSIANLTGLTGTNTVATFFVNSTSGLTGDVFKTFTLTATAAQVAAVGGVGQQIGIGIIGGPLTGTDANVSQNYDLDNVRLDSLSYAVTFDSNGGSAVESQQVEYNDTATIPTDPTRTGYTFGGWFTDNGTFLNAYNFATPVTGAVALFAKWTINNYTVSYNGNTSNGGTAPATQNGDYNTTITAAANTFTKTGNAFFQWNTAADGSGTAVNADASFTIPASNTTFYAQWTAVAVPTQLVVTVVPTGTTLAGDTFSVTVQAQSAGGAPGQVSSNTGISLAASGAGTLAGNTATINAGSAVVTLTGVTYTKAEAITLTASVTSGPALTTSVASSSFTVSPNVVSVANSTAVANPASLAADGSATSTVTVTLKDAYNNLLAGTNVTWSVAGTGNNVTPASPGTTDGSGVASFTVKSVNPEAKTVTVNVGATVITDSLQITFTPTGSPNVLTWDPANNTTGSDGDGTWSTSTANWAINSTDFTWPNSGDAAAVFGSGVALAANYAVTMGTPVTVGNLTFNTTDTNQYTLGNQQTITLAGTPAISVAGAATIAGPLAGTGFSKTGAGTLTLSGASTYTGDTTVTNGTLQLLRPGTITSSAGVTVPTNGTLLFNNNGGNYASVIPPISLNGGTLSNFASASQYTWATNGSGAVTANAPSVIDLVQTTVGNGGLFLDGGLQGSAALIVNADVNGAAVGLVLRTANSTYSGSLTVNGVASDAVGAGSGLVVGGTQTADPSNVCNLPNATITVNGTMAMGVAGTNDMSWAAVDASGQPVAALSGTTFQMDALNGTGVVVANFKSTGTRTLSLGNNNGSGSFSGVIAAGVNSTLSLIKNGSGTQTLSGTNTYSGDTTVSDGTLALGSSTALPDASPVSIANATLNAATTGIEDAGTLDVTGNATINLASGAQIEFDDSNGSWAGTLTLTGILDFSGDPSSSLRFGTTSGGLDPTNQLSKISAAGFTGFTVNGSGYLTATATGSPYSTWAVLKGLDGTPGKDPAKTADPDNDGRNNLAEFALDGNPLSGANDGKVVGRVGTVGGSQVMTLTLPVRGTAPTPLFSNSGGDALSDLVDGIYYRIEGDVNLSTFADTITEVTGAEATAIQNTLPAVTIPADGWTLRTFRAPGTVPTAPKAFLRAKISETP